MTDATAPKPPLTDPELLRDTMTAALAEPAYWDTDGYNTITEFHREEWRLIVDLIGEGIAARRGPVQGTTEIAQRPDGSWTATIPNYSDTFAPPVCLDDPPLKLARDTDWTHPVITEPARVFDVRHASDPNAGHLYDDDPAKLPPITGLVTLPDGWGSLDRLPPSPWPVTPNAVLMEPGDRTPEDADRRFAQYGGTIVTSGSTPSADPGGVTLTESGYHTHPEPITGWTGTFSLTNPKAAPLLDPRACAEAAADPLGPEPSPKATP